ncbi:DNA mismatch repair protein mutL [Spirochaeta thermophila DSM 6578]|uniref:DNA mismatch repair protein MutL n=1 Tax=Winmispira thermophila (strain ATCC 700085 / DSM 6578 / Z-1203) TaxID=869211 RepID=G0GAJ2_WINT7|nr:DNA mismatch repair endonuclease MutL [Spirochaeta thermophila]AEJ60957.1 DNA mismatch repair protein mutL [Spirochaeta thermophila DSM 6578]
MNDRTSAASPRIKLLEEAVFRKIAAGEVIDRPAAVVRELLDNALDAASTEITVEISQGGIERILVLDDGEGMVPEDVRRCYLPHATSKIRSEQDLLAVTTLGFRGEALGSIAAVATTRIASRARGTPSGYFVLVDRGRLVEEGETHLPEGTRVEVERLFSSFPARKRFLKNPSTEGLLCRRMVVEKALPFPHVAFRFVRDGQMEFYLPPQDLLARVCAALPELFKPSASERFEVEQDEVRIEGVLLSPAFPQRDRRHIRIYLNRRLVQEFSLAQAVAYGYRGVLPGGQYPAAVVFLTLPPERVDFNVHPAKREAKIRGLSSLHALLARAVEQALKDWIGVRRIAPTTGRPETVGETERVYRPHPEPSRSGTGELFTGPSHTFTLPSDSGHPPSPRTGEGFTYLGQAFGVFLVVEREGTLLLVDQHAAHERILYNRLTSHPSSQELLFPYAFPVDADEAARLEDAREEIEALGIRFVLEEGRCTLTHLPAPLSDAPHVVAQWLKGERLADPERDAYATLACRGAIKEGEVVDRLTALDLLSQTFSLEEPFCPHGRPLWVEITREELFRRIRRIV